MGILSAFSWAIIKRHSTPNIDNLIFRLHYRVTTLILAAAAILVISREHFGSPIICGPAPPSLTTTFLENYCWTHSTYSLITTNNGEPYPGINTKKSGDPVFYHTYYQWVWLTLSLQAAMFYFPRFYWKKIENGRIACLVKGLTEPLCDQDLMDNRISLVAQYIVRNYNKFNKMAYGFFICELFNFINVVGQIYIIDWFFGGTFATFGSNVFKNGLNEEFQHDSLRIVFPRLTKCKFSMFGASGALQMHDAICVLPLNIINEKIYIFLWFWLILLAIPSGFVILYRLCLLFEPSLRSLVLSWQFTEFRKSAIDMNAKIGDWLFFNMLAKNLDSFALKKLLDKLQVENWGNLVGFKSS